MHKHVVNSILLVFSLFIWTIAMPTDVEATSLLDKYQKEKQLLVTEQSKMTLQVKSAQSKVDSLVRENKLILQNASKIRAELDVIQSELTVQRKKISSLNQQIKNYRKNNQALARGTKAQKSKFNKELKALQTTYSDVQTKVAKLVNERTKVNKRYTDCKNQLNRNRDDLAKSRKELAAKKEALRQTTSKISQLDVQIAKEGGAASGKPDISIKPTQPKQKPKEPYLVDAPSLTEQEQELARLINEYRTSLGLQALPVSKSLTTVARSHVNDSNQYSPENGTDHRNVKCNLHSWSANGNWNPVCYTSDHQYSQLMWSKPRELTDYQGNGYEISMYGSWKLSPTNALGAWKGSPGHNNVIIGDGAWSDLTVMGVAIHENYAHVWFGMEADPAGYFQ